MDSKESYHCIRVLRNREGSEVHLTDGKGFMGKGIISDANEKACRVEITQWQKSTAILPYQLHIAIAPTKSRDRYEWFLEKATEIGVTSVTPIICARSERKKLRVDRMEQVVLSAMKQSWQAWKPQLGELLSFEKWVIQSRPGTNYIAHCMEGEKVSLTSMEPSEAYHILIGPEGDFTPEEVEMAVKNGFRPLSLGSTRLRTETAGIMACASARLMHQV